MSLFDSFNKPSWQHRDPEARKAAIEGVDDVAILAELVRDDPDEDVKSLALSRISDDGLLDTFSRELTASLQEQARKQLLQSLLPDPSGLSSIGDEEKLERIAGLTDDPILMADCIDRLGMSRRFSLAVDHPLAKIRIAAAQGIEDEEQLKQLLAQSRHKDKSVYKLCRERLDRMHEAARAEAELKEQIRQLSEDANALSKAVDSPEYKSRFQVLDLRWTQLKEHAGEQQRQEISDNLELCAGRIEQTRKAMQSELDQQQQLAEAKQAFAEVIEELSRIDLAELDLTAGRNSQEFVKRLDTIEDRWLAAMQLAQPTAGQTDECKQQLSMLRGIAQISRRVADRKQALDRLQDEHRQLGKSDYMAHHKLLAKVERQLDKLPWPESHGALTPEAIRDLTGLKETLQDQIEKLRTQEKNKLQQLDAAFSALRKELDDSHFNNADRHHNRIRNLLKQLGPEHQDHYHQELRPLTARLNEIHDWQGFAIEPKKIELCDRMAELVGSKEAPDALAAKIKALQEEWKQLGHISPRRDQQLWKKFHAAAEEAYKPCKEAFARQSEARKENFRQRMAIVGQLIDYDDRMNWPGSPDSDPGAAAPDWRKVQQTLDTARAAFNRIKPVDGRGERKSRKALQDICDRIYSHIKEEYGRNIAIKEQLVSEAESLAELENLRDAINRAKSIQREWKDVGMTPRQVDRKLWKKLRKACDAVFGRLDEQRKVETAAKNERAEQAKLRARQEREKWPRLLDRMRACAIRAESADEADQLWNQEGAIPRGIDKDALQAWWDQGTDGDVPEDQLRQACIAMEILLEIDSPAEDKEARMEYQMQRLLEGMGSAQGRHDDRLISQLNAFIAMRPPAEWLQRFVCEGKIIPQKNRPGD